MNRNRRSIRLKGYDYSRAGAYFVTICTENRQCLFGDVVDGEMVLNDAGRIAADEWIRTAEIRREIELDRWIVMPNHVHGIIVITNAHGVGAHGRAPQQADGVGADGVGAHGVGADGVGADGVGAHGVGAHGRAPRPSDGQPPRGLIRPPKSLGSLIAGFKSAVTKRINEARNTPGVPVWQRNYYEHVIRDERSLNRIREYVTNNPTQWETDRENPNNPSGDSEV